MHISFLILAENSLLGQRNVPAIFRRHIIQRPCAYAFRVPMLRPLSGLLGCFLNVLTGYACFIFCSHNALFGMGNPLLDICAVVDKDFLDK